MKRAFLIIDVARCEDCNDCFLACKDEHAGNDFPPYSAAQPRQACLKAATGGAVYQREDGIVIIDPVKAKGQKAIVASCPYGAVWWNEELQVPQKCTFCAHLLDDGWKEPRCVQACPTGALLHPEYGTQPRVYYKNLYRFARCFIGGSVAREVNGVTDCVEGARVTLRQGSSNIAATVTDNYGDFKFDNLEENSGSYTVEISWPGHETKTLAVDLKTSVNLGTIWL